jgi:predicted nucleic acid-binding protein
MKIVLDANIFVSAYIWSGIPNAVIERVDDKLDILYITELICPYFFSLYMKSSPNLSYL